MRIYISKDANKILIDYLMTFTKDIVYISKNGTYPAIDNHPDIRMCQIDNEVFMGDLNKIGYKYPDDIIYNGVCIGDYFIHNTKYTDKLLLAEIEKNSYKIINVKQGYTKCNVVPVGNTSLITSDIGIAKACSPYLDVLTISNGNILLPGVNYGFIGGCSGMINDTIIFNGNLAKHPDYTKILKFIESKGYKAKWFIEYELTDIGSIIVEN